MTKRFRDRRKSSKTPTYTGQESSAAVGDNFKISIKRSTENPVYKGVEGISKPEVPVKPSVWNEACQCP